MCVSFCVRLGTRYPCFWVGKGNKKETCLSSGHGNISELGSFLIESLNVPDRTQVFLDVAAASRKLQFSRCRSFAFACGWALEGSNFEGGAIVAFACGLDLASSSLFLRYYTNISIRVLVLPSSEWLTPLPCCNGNI